MHEFTITQNLLQTALAQANLQEGERIEQLAISLDPESGYAPDAIRFYFEQLANNTPAAGAQLTFAITNTPQHIRLTEIGIEQDEYQALAQDKPIHSHICLITDEQGAIFAKLLAADLGIACQLRRKIDGIHVEVTGEVAALKHFAEHFNQRT